MNKKIRLFENFAGIGSQHLALSNVIGSNNVDLVGISEWDINSSIVYNNIHFNNIEPLEFNINNKDEIIEYILSNNAVFSGDTKTPISINSLKRKKGEYLKSLANSIKNTNNISTVLNLKNNVNNIRNIDMFTYSFPCQSISIQGNKTGLSENSGTSSSLLWEIKYFLENSYNSQCRDEKNIYGEFIKLPEYLLMENVKALFSVKNIGEWVKFKKFLDSIGYETEDIILKASNFGIPQNRDRVFGLSIKKENKNKNIIFNNFKDLKNKSSTNEKIDEFLDKSLNKNDIDKLKIKECFQIQKNKFNKSKLSVNGILKLKLDNYSNFNSENMVFHSKKSIAPTITAIGAQSRVKIYDVDNDVIRIMTPKEHLNLMGFNFDIYNRIDKNLISDALIKKMAGNSIVVNVLVSIFKIIIDNK